MMLDSGLLTVCRLENKALPGAMPDMKLIEQSKHYYGERTVGYNRLYAARGANEQIDLLVRIWQNRFVRAGMYVVTEDDVQYRIDTVQQLFDEDGLAVSDLSLSRLETYYEVHTDND